MDPHRAPELLHVTDLTKRYGRVAALQSVSFGIRPGEILGLIGPNGSGKTTLFECLAGVLPADRGEVLANGRPLGKRRASLLFYLPDAIAPWPAQSVAWALDFAAGFFESARVGARAEELIRCLDLRPLLDVPIQALSKGQRKRALLAVALRMPHPLLLLDEPFEGLDLRQTRDVEALLKDEARAGRTLFLSIHQIGQAARTCDRFVLLSAGRVAAEGTLDDLTTLSAPRRQTATADLEEVFLALT